MASYTYCKLHKGQIRLVTLFPGTFPDDIIVQLQHADMPAQKQPQTRRMTLDEVKESLPRGWNAYEALDNKYLFYSGELGLGGTFKSTWTHPDPDVDASRYALPADDHKQDDQGVCYEALSYTWGSADKTAVVWVQEPNAALPARLPIHQNLDTALRHLRHASNSRTLWVDAISINQSDIAERDEQVTYMPNIYRRASRVVAWLGPSADDSTHALVTLDYLGRQVVQTVDEWQFSSPEATDSSWALSKCALPYDERTWQAIHSLVSRAWFERVWVLQEIQLATRRAVVKCGDAEIPWTRFRYAITNLWQKQSMPSLVRRRRIGLVGQMASAHNLITPISSTVNRTWGRYCSDPRDMVYGLLGLLPPGFAAKIRPQYSLPVGEVYKGFLLTHIEHTGSLELLRVANLETRRADAPSWVPNFSSPYTHPMERYFYSGYSAPTLKFRAPNVLDVTGVRCGVVETVTEPNPSPETQGSAALRLVLEATRKWQPENLQTGKYVTGESLISAYSRTLTGDYLKDRFPEMPLMSRQEWERQDSECSLFGRKSKQNIPGRISFSYQKNYALNLLMGRTFITTQDGYIGLGPAQAQQGDIACVRLGFDRPVLLRQQQDGSFLFVGSCFIYGLDDLNVLLGPLPPPWQVQVLHDSEGFLSRFRYFNNEESCLSDEDPRLGPLVGWERLEVDRSGDDPFLLQCFRNKSTGEVVKADPRLRFENLEARGVKFEVFPLV